MLKKQIRKEYLQKRLALPDEEWQLKTTLIVSHFKSLPLPHVSYLLSYYPLSEKKEFDVSACVEILQKQSPEIIIAFPKTAANELHMEARILDEKKLFVKNRFNLFEPRSGEYLESKLIDVVFVPLLAFDRKGYRVGYGKGFYDFYLASCKPEIVKIGFSFFEPLELIDDINEFDVPLNFCITPMRVYEF